MRYSFLISILLLAQAYSHSPFKGICDKLFISSRFPSYPETSDVVKKGIPSPVWDPCVEDQVIVSAAKNLEYFYLIDADFELEQSNIKLLYEDMGALISKVLLKKEQGGQYTIEVSHNCDVYGGIVVEVGLEIEVPGCGKTTIAWKKLCGNPYTERDGLSVDLLMKNSRKTVVRNGKPFDPKYFDRDIDNYAFLVPSSVNKITLELYMNSADLEASPSEASVHAFKSLSQNPEKKMQVDTNVAMIRADSDKNVVGVTLHGNLARQGGVLTNTSREVVDVFFECTEKGGNSTIELDVIMPVFKDLSLFLVKNCGHPPASGRSWTFYILISMMIVICYLAFRDKDSKLKKTITSYISRVELHSLYTKIVSVIEKYRSRIMKRTRGPSSNRNDEFMIANGESESQELNKNNKYIVI